MIDICVDEIDSLIAKLNEISDKINELKSAIRCPECGAINDEEAIYWRKMRGEDVPRAEGTGGGLDRNYRRGAAFGGAAGAKRTGISTAEPL